jgi:hypothetical protein
MNIHSRILELVEGSRGLARHGRIVKALTKKADRLFGKTRGLKPGEPEYKARLASVSAEPGYFDRFRNYNRLARGQQSRDRVQISRERMRAGLSPKIPSETVNVAHGDRTGTWRIKSEPKSQSPGSVGKRVPKAVLKYREASAAKAAAGKAKSVSEGAVKDALADYMYSIPQAAVAELRPVMGIGNLTRRFGMITKVLKKHGFTQKFMGSYPANIVNDYYETFFG